LQQRASKHLEITHQDLLSQLKTWAESDITETMCLSADEIKELPIEIRRLITKFKRTVVTTKLGDTIETIELTFVSKETAIDMINKHIGFYELDNRQRKPEIDVSKLGSDVIKSLLDASR
jgi:phage terminase small subunit